MNEPVVGTPEGGTPERSELELDSQSQLPRYIYYGYNAIIKNYNYYCTSDNSKQYRSAGVESNPQQSVHPAVSSGDFGRITELKKERALVDQEKYYLLKNHFRPNSPYRFPSRLYGSRHRSFQHSWLTQFNGLVYSEIDQGGYCKYCVMFG